MITTQDRSGLTQLTLDNSRIHATVLPELGGKMSSLVRVATGREFLRPAASQPVKPAVYGAVFGSRDANGFDECFPTIAACQYIGEYFGGLAIPDHGELWSSRWQFEIRGEELWLAATGRRLPFIFRKRIRLEDETVAIQYELESVTDAPFHYLWSAHPLLRVDPGCRIILPTDVTDVLVESSRNQRLGNHGDSARWPRTSLADGSETDLSILGDPSRQTADKLFTPRLSQGACGLYYPDSNESVSFHFNSAVVPYLGIWICEGGWPNPEDGHYTVALEPCTSPVDSLAEAVGRGDSAEIRPGTKRFWELRVQLQIGLPEDLADRIEV
jgi:galactose mutarotase-like enzyme